MKIVHICMVAYLDGWGYQDNLLPDYMAKLGHDVVVVSSANHFPSFLKEEDKKKIIAKGTDYSCGPVHVYRIDTKLNTSNYSFYCIGLYQLLEKEQPDVIFHHDINSSSMLIAWWYCLNNSKTKFFVDSHADYLNESKKKIWNMLVPRGIMKLCTKLVQHRVTKFYGVTPGRCSYLQAIYGAPLDKISLLPIGSDTDFSDKISNDIIKLRHDFSIPADAIVIISGGKMGIDKGTDALIKAVGNLKAINKKIYLILFGSFQDEKTKELAVSSDFVKMFGWCDRQTTLELLKISDIACWPIHHTTLIEDALGCAIPLVVRYTDNTSHILSGNGEYVETGSDAELTKKMSLILENYSAYKKIALSKKEQFSYQTIVKQIEQDCI